MKITTKNYFDKVKEIGLENLPLILKESHSAIIAKTDHGNDWTLYKTDKDLKAMIDLAFQKIEEYQKAEGKTLSGLDGKDSPEVKRAKEDAKGYHKLSTERLKMILRLENDVELEEGLLPEVEIRKTAIEKILNEREGKQKVETKTKSKNPYSSIVKEVQFIDRFLAFHDKILYKNTFGIFIDELQKAIEEKKITKKSPVAKEIMEIQQAAINAFNTMYNAKHFVLKPATIKHLKSIIEKYDNSHEDIDKTYVKTKKKGIGLSGISLPSPQVNIMPSTDFANLQFNTIGFKDKWLNFIGDPAPGFTAMVFGMPKMGKSYLCVDFAGYLARNHGKVLYVAKEEKLDATLQQKLKDKQVAHENLDVADALPEDLSNYDFIFLDSVNKLGLSPQDLNKLKADNKGKSFIYIFQATKGGKFKGNNEFQHDVDVVIEVPEQGKAIQFGRFNQGGAMDIFSNEEESISPSEEESLLGLDGKEGKTKRYSKHEEIPDISEPYFYDFSRKGWDGASRVIRKKILKDVPNADKYLNYEWIDLKPALKQKILDFHFGWRVEPKVKPKTKVATKKTTKKKTKEPDWTEPEYLNAADHWRLKEIKKLYEEGNMRGAMNMAMDGDTVIREEIPPDIWVAMGGSLTSTGEEKLRKLLAERAKKK